MKSFLLYKDKLKAALAMLTDAQAGQLFKAITSYHDGEEVNPSDPMVKMAFEMMRLDMDKNIEAYNAKVEKCRASGRAGGMAKASKSKQSLANASERYNSLGNNNNSNSNNNSKCIYTDTLPQSMKEPVMTWVGYLESQGKTVGQIQVEAICRHLYQLSNGNPKTAEKIVAQSVRNQWQDLYMLHETKSDRAKDLGIVLTGNNEINEKDNDIFNRE